MTSPLKFLDSKLQAIRREAGEDPNDLTRLGSTATSQRALALSRVNKNHPRLARSHLVPTADTGLLLTAPVGPAPPVSSSSLSPTPRLCTTPHSSKRLECGYADPCVTPVVDAKTRSATEPSAEPPWTGKANTRQRARADTPSPRGTTRCETRLRTLRDEPAFVQTSKSLWTTLPLTPKTAREWT